MLQLKAQLAQPEMMDSWQNRKGDFAKIFLISDKRNKNGWRVTWESIKKHAYDFVDRPGIIYSKCEAGKCDLDHTDGQTYESNLEIQEPFRETTLREIIFDEDKHKAYAIHEIHTPSVAKKLHCGELKFVSPAIWPIQGQYRILGRMPNGNLKVDVWGWKALHDAFVNNPAFGDEAKVVAMCHDSGNACRMQMLKASADLEPLQEVPLLVKHRGHHTFVSATKCVYDLIQSKLEHGVIVDEVALQNAQNQCGAKKATCNCINTLAAKVAKLELLVKIRALEAAIGGEQKGDWITTKNNHKVFIPEGQNVKDVLKKHFEKKSSKDRGKKPKPKFKSAFLKNKPNAESKLIEGKMPSIKSPRNGFISPDGDFITTKPIDGTVEHGDIIKQVEGKDYKRSEDSSKYAVRQNLVRVGYSKIKGKDLTYVTFGDKATETQLRQIKSLIDDANSAGAWVNIEMRSKKQSIYAGDWRDFVSQKTRRGLSARIRKLALWAKIQDVECGLYAEDDKKGRWITSKGNPVFIPEGQDVGDVLKEHFDKLKKSDKKPAKTPDKTSGFTNHVEKITVADNISKEQQVVVGHIKDAWNNMDIDKNVLQSLEVLGTDSSFSYYGTFSLTDREITISAEKININFSDKLSDKELAESTLYHEYGHAIHESRPKKDQKRVKYTERITNAKHLTKYLDKFSREIDAASAKLKEYEDNYQNALKNRPIIDSKIRAGLKPDVTLADLDELRHQQTKIEAVIFNYEDEDNTDKKYLEEDLRDARDVYASETAAEYYVIKNGIKTVYEHDQAAYDQIDKIHKEVYG